MKRMILAVLVWGITAWFLPAPTSAQEQGGMDHEEMMGMMGGMDMGMMGMGKGMCDMQEMGGIGMLDLSREQQVKIRKIQDDLRKEHWAIMGRIMDEQAKLRDLYDEETLDQKKIGAVYDTLSGLRKQMMMTKLDAMVKIRGLLSKDQLEQLKKMKRGGMGMMGGMGEGRHRGMMGP